MLRHRPFLLRSFSFQPIAGAAVFACFLLLASGTLLPCLRAQDVADQPAKVPPPLRPPAAGGDESTGQGQGSIDEPAGPMEGAAMLPQTAGSTPSGADAASGKASSEEEDALAAREAVLEKIADSLSARMKALSERERVLREQEAALESRVRAISEREAALEARENLLERQEKLPPPQPWGGGPAPSIVGKYAAVIDAQSGQFYHLKDADTQTPVASTQKLLTSLLVIRDGDLDATVVVPPEVNGVEPTLIGIKPGEEYVRRDLLKALLVRSGNDVAVCLAVDNAGSVEAFADKMNAYALSLGMENSHFVNPHGLPDSRQYSTAHDMALLAFEAYHNPVIREFVQITSCEFELGSGTPRTLINTNKVLRNYDFCNGMKTGYTNASGYCLVSSGAKEERERIVVVLGSSGTWVWKDSQVLLEWALSAN